MLAYTYTDIYIERETEKQRKIQSNHKYKQQILTQHTHYYIDTHTHIYGDIINQYIQKRKVIHI